MKKIILLLAFCLSVGNLFAQDANADKLREEGDAAMTAKNYPEVVAKYSEYLKLTNYEDESRIFNCAFAAYNAKKYDDAIKFYDMAIQKGYKADDAYVGKAMSLRSQDQAADFTNIKATLCTALALCSTMQVQKFWPMPTRSQHPIQTNTLLKRKKQMLKWQKQKVIWNRQSL